MLISVISLLLTLCLFLCSLLIFFNLSFVVLWKVSIVTTEYGHWMFFLPLSIAIFCRFQNPLCGTSTIISLVTVALLLWPSINGQIIAQTIPDRLEKSFGTAELTTGPFEWRRLWFGLPVKRIRTERYVYAQHGGNELYFRFFRSYAGTDSPCIVVIHTGGWDSGSPDEFEMMNQYLASKGYAVAAISYRFAPQWKWPAQKKDVLAAIGYIKQNAGTLGVDPTRFALFGRSAGGQIAEAVACTAYDPAIKGCIAFYAPADLNFAYEHLSPEPDILDSRTLLENYLGGSQRQARSNYDHASPYHHVSMDTPPTLLVHGTKDPLTWYKQSERFSKKLSDYAIPNVYIELPWGTHAFDYNFNGPGGQVSRYAAEWFLASLLKTPKP